MISAQELAAVSFFVNVPAEELAGVAAAAADVRLGSGEFAIHEGDERVLFRTIGARAPGQIFGEVPIIFGTPFQGSYHAVEPTRLARLEAREFHTLAAASPELLTTVATLARERISGLQGIATKPAAPRALLVADRYDRAGHALRTFLAGNQITFEWLTPDAPNLPAKWPGPVPEPSELPALRCDDGRTTSSSSCAASRTSASSCAPS